MSQRVNKLQLGGAVSRGAGPGSPDSSFGGECATRTVLYEGALVTVYGVLCEVDRLLPAGTIEVSEVNEPRAWRVSGLAVCR